MNGLLEWIIFIALSAVAVITAAGMILTMSMYRAGLALMASFVALAGLFILLDADLMAAIQIMMNVGGMLVMVLFMVMMMMDPGGEMMWGMKRDMHMPGPGAFSMHMPGGKPPEDEPPTGKMAPPIDWTCSMHPEVSQLNSGNCPKCGMALIPRAETNNEQDGMEGPTQASLYTCSMHPEIQLASPGNCPKCGMALLQVNDTTQDMSHMAMPAHSMNMNMSDGEMDTSDHDMNMTGMSMTPRQNYQMMVDMAMSTAQLPWAIALGIASALLLIVLIVQTPWPLAQGGPTQDATTAVGELLLSRYMIGFEGAAFLILTGIAGAVLFAKRERGDTPPKEEQQLIPLVEKVPSRKESSHHQGGHS